MRIVIVALALGSLLSACSRASAPTGLGVPDLSPQPDAEVKAEAELPYDAQFIDAMIAYANYTKDLADIGFRRAHKEELKVYAENLRQDQKTRIAELENWRALWFGKARADTMNLDQAARNIGVSPYEFGVAWKAVPVDLDPLHPESVRDVTVATDVETWGVNEQLAALREIPDAAFDAFYTATLVQHDIWGMEATHTSLPRLERPELQLIGQNVVTDNLIHLNQVARWRNEWFGAETEGMVPEDRGTR